MGEKSSKRSSRKILFAATAASGLLLSTAVHGSRAAPAQGASPIKIGISISLTGDFSGDGKSIQRGYNLWAANVNKTGGLLGRRVVLDYVDDGSSTTQITTNIQKLINSDHVDLLVGGFSSLLTIPAAITANRFGYAFPEPAGGGPAVFANKLPNLFFVQPAPVVDNVVSFTKWLKSLPTGRRPKTAAYATENDPFAQPQIDKARTLLSRAGVRTVYNAVFPNETPDFGPIALNIVHSGAQVAVIGTTGLPEATAFITTFIQQHYNPKALLETSGPDQGALFSKAIGGNQTEGIIVPAGWWPGAKTFQNSSFVKGYVAKFGGLPRDIPQDASEAFSVGQVVAQAVTKIKTVDNASMIRELHKDRFQTVQGPMKFNKLGQPQGQMFLVQWQKGRAVPVYPPKVAAAKPEYPKRNWK
jgi:branched-chain amino acid transport system substrate-binding protein